MSTCWVAQRKTRVGKEDRQSSASTRGTSVGKAFRKPRTRCVQRAVTYACRPPAVVERLPLAERPWVYLPLFSLLSHVSLPCVSVRVMARNRPRLLLACYDIADPRRLARVHSFMVKHAVPLQYSVFITRMSTPQLEWLISRLRLLINPREDDIRIYTLPESLGVHAIGRQYLPPDVLILAETQNLTWAPGEHP